MNDLTTNDKQALREIAASLRSMSQELNHIIRNGDKYDLLINASITHSFSDRGERCDKWQEGSKPCEPCVMCNEHFGGTFTESEVDYDEFGGSSVANGRFTFHTTADENTLYIDNNGTQNEKRCSKWAKNSILKCTENTMVPDSCTSHHGTFTETPAEQDVERVQAWQCVFPYPCGIPESGHGEDSVIKHPFTIAQPTVATDEALAAAVMKLELEGDDGD